MVSLIRVLNGHSALLGLILHLVVCQTGLVLLNKSQPDQGSANSLPVTLFPTRYPRNEFDYAMKIQNDFNILVNSVANDYNLLRDSLKE